MELEEVRLVFMEQVVVRPEFTEPEAAHLQVTELVVVPLIMVRVPADSKRSSKYAGSFLFLKLLLRLPTINESDKRN